MFINCIFTCASKLKTTNCFIAGKGYAASRDALGIGKDPGMFCQCKIFE
jgi:hypothetical protein